MAKHFTETFHAEGVRTWDNWLGNVIGAHNQLVDEMETLKLSTDAETKDGSPGRIMAETNRRKYRFYRRLPGIGQNQATYYTVQATRSAKEDPNTGMCPNMKRDILTCDHFHMYYTD